MTSKEIAVAVGKTERSVQMWAKKTGEKISQVGEKISQAAESKKPADFDLAETCEIIQHGMGKNAADLYRMSAAQPGKPVRQVGQVGQVDEDRIARIAARAAVAAIREMFPHMAGPAASVPFAMLPSLPPLDLRSQFRDAIHEARISTGEEYGILYNRVYRELRNRARVDVHALARNHGTSAMDETERAGLLPLAIQIAEAMN